jgi:preprotein translocase subunit YajC
MTQIGSILLMTGKGGESPVQMLVMMALIIGVFYFFMIRPQMKRQKELKKFRDELEKGSKVITIGGIHGKVLEVGETTITIEVDNNVKLKVEKNGIIKDTSGMMGQK